LESLADLPVAGSANVTKTPLPQRPLSQLHDRFNVWIDTALSSLVETWENPSQLGGGFKYFLFSRLFGEDSHFD